MRFNTQLLEGISMIQLVARAYLGTPEQRYNGLNDIKLAEA
jgi:hypothetical protein